MTDSEYVLYFDGCSKGNPGEAGAGAVIYQNGVEIWDSCSYVGKKESNNVAEYNGMIMGMTEAIERKIKKLSVKGDSMLVIKQMKGDYKVRSANLIEWYNKSKSLEKHFDTVAYEHVYRKDNARADKLSNDGIMLNY